ncbi:DUF2770 family protein [Yersinia aldovae]|uniref:Protein of uncharacterized function (DUF2770) n=1 Tax=Yersinia aldovae TaxID=29483 RepID=A0A0T9U9S1_YERAL|nr:DUF2770 family protein [Yersinia aldovae]AJJ62046.1 hypothetical protein AT01_901 [Yersinia aldovae 670-83]EEP96732.1 hypothetical protein yaldo0001_20160 [Yersinia aldovae ATCC 35236]CNJ96158.1 Protein of uncharacterised function (DUF2770) [Yersinia aldovae]CNL10618.1 Protein of uncharacterised function (DUF2770) [Yersinia aldovae]CNL28358.1 Protein of uncharacterised function (DUF2770) [Yersinia aldovae]
MLNKLFSIVIDNVREHLVFYICLLMILLALDVYFFFYQTFS